MYVRYTLTFHTSPQQRFSRKAGAPVFRLSKDLRKKIFLTFRFGYFIELDLELFSSYLAKKTGFVKYQKEKVE